MADSLKSGFSFLKTQWKWVIFGLVCFMFFNLLKFPEAKVRAIVQANINSFLNENGLVLASKSSSLSILTLSYKLNGVTLYLPSGGNPIKVDQVKASTGPLNILMYLAFNKIGASVEMEQGDAEADFNFTFSEKEMELSVDFDIEDLKIEKTGLAAYLPVSVKGKVEASGSMEASLKGNAFSIQDGELKLEIEDVSTPPQHISGFQIPGLSVASGEAVLKAVKGKVNIKKFVIGKPGDRNSKDDINLDVKGSIQLKPGFLSSELDLVAQMGLSEKIMSKFAIFKSLLKAAEQKDGSYKYKIAGQIDRGIIPIPYKGN